LHRVAIGVASSIFLSAGHYFFRFARRSPCANVPGLCSWIAAIRTSGFIPAPVVGITTGDGGLCEESGNNLEIPQARILQRPAISGLQAVFIYLG